MASAHRRGRVRRRVRDEGVKYHVKGKSTPTAASGTVN